MTKITIITQNFSSPNDYNNTPLMLLPQASIPPPPPPTSSQSLGVVSEKDQDGFSQLLLHDRHRQRQSYVQSYTAFETLKKRQDFVLRQESLRSLQNFIERMANKQDQSIDQSFHSYKQCFGKFINVRSSTHRNLQEQQKRPKTAGPSYEPLPTRQVLHTPATPFDPPPVPVHHYQKSHRPSSSTKYRSNANSFRGGKSRQDTWRSPSFISHSQPFFSFTESYFQKHGDKSSSKSPTTGNNNYSDRSLNRFPKTADTNVNRPTSKSQTIRYNTDQRLSKKPPIKTHTDEERPPSQCQIPIDEDNQKFPLVTDDDDDDDDQQLPNEIQITRDDSDDELLIKPSVVINIYKDQSSRKSPITQNNDDNGLRNESLSATKHSNDRPLSKPSTPPATTSNLVNTTEVPKDEDEEKVVVEEYRRPASSTVRSSVNQSIKQEHRTATPNLSQIRVTISSNPTNTPVSSPQMSYTDALRDGLVIDKIADQQDHSIKMPIVNEERRLSQHSNTQIGNTSNKTSTKRPKTAKKKHTIVVDLPTGTKIEPITAENDEQEPLENAMTVQNYLSNPVEPTAPTKTKRRKSSANTTSLQSKKPPSIVRRPSIKLKNDRIETKDHVNTQMNTVVASEQKEAIVDQKTVEIIAPVTNIISEPQLQVEVIDDSQKRPKKGAFDSTGSVNGMIHFELKTLGSHRNVVKRTRFNLGKENNQQHTEKVIEPNPETLELLEKIRHSEIGTSIGKMSVSKQGCRFELPSDLKKLEDLNPLEYIGKYCRLSPHRNYQFKRIFEKYRNNKYCLDTNNLYAAIIDIHTDNFTRSQYDHLCRLIDIENQEVQFKFETFAGILAVCERIVYDALNSSSDVEDYHLAKDPLEKCDFDSLDRKLDGFAISDKMRKLLQTL